MRIKTFEYKPRPNIYFYNLCPFQLREGMKRQRYVTNSTVCELIREFNNGHDLAVIKYLGSHGYLLLRSYLIYRNSIEVRYLSLQEQHRSTITVSLEIHKVR